jgi:hypothetical protein
MQVEALTSYARLWSSEALHEQAEAWVQGAGKAFLDLSTSQLGALEEAASRGELHSFLEDAAKPNRPAVWRWLRDTLPFVLTQALERGRSGGTREAEAYRKLKGKILDPQRDGSIQREFLAALIKAYRKAKEQKSWQNQQSASSHSKTGT